MGKKEELAKRLEQVPAEWIGTSMFQRMYDSQAMQIDLAGWQKVIDMQQKLSEFGGRAWKYFEQGKLKEAYNTLLACFCVSQEMKLSYKRDLEAVKPIFDKLTDRYTDNGLYSEFQLLIFNRYNNALQEMKSVISADMDHPEGLDFLFKKIEAELRTMERSGVTEWGLRRRELTDTILQSMNIMENGNVQELTEKVKELLSKEEGYLQAIEQLEKEIAQLDNKNRKLDKKLLDKIENIALIYNEASVARHIVIPALEIKTYKDWVDLSDRKDSIINKIGQSLQGMLPDKELQELIHNLKRTNELSLMESHQVVTKLQTLMQSLPPEKQNSLWEDLQKCAKMEKELDAKLERIKEAKHQASIIAKRADKLVSLTEQGYLFAYHSQEQKNLRVNLGFFKPAVSDLNVVFNTLTGDSFSKAEVKQNKCGAQIGFELKSKDYKLTVRLKALESDYQLSIDGVTGRGTEKETFAIGKDKKEGAQKLVEDATRSLVENADRISENIMPKLEVKLIQTVNKKDIVLANFDMSVTDLPKPSKWISTAFKSAKGLQEMSQVRQEMAKEALPTEREDLLKNLEASFNQACDINIASKTDLFDELRDYIKQLPHMDVDLKREELEMLLTYDDIMNEMADDIVATRLSGHPNLDPQAARDKITDLIYQDPISVFNEYFKDADLSHVDQSTKNALKEVGEEDIMFSLMRH